MKSKYHDNSTPKYSDIDIAYMQSLSAAVVQRSPKYLLMIVSIITFLVFVALLWMSWAEIDVVVRGNGKVIPARQVQLIQSLEGGIISEILVREGDLVESNQPLIKISDVAFSSSFEENRLSYYQLRAKSARLKAEAYGGEFEGDEDNSNNELSKLIIPGFNSKSILLSEIMFKPKNQKIIRLALEIGLITLFIPEFKRIRSNA